MLSMKLRRIAKVMQGQDAPKDEEVFHPAEVEKAVETLIDIGKSDEGIQKAVEKEYAESQPEVVETVKDILETAPEKEE